MSSLQASVPNGIRHNPEEFPEVLKRGEVLAEIPLGASAAVQDTVNRTPFPKYWDAELRAEVYVSEYVEKKPGRLAALVNTFREKTDLRRDTVILL